MESMAHLKVIERHGTVNIMCSGSWHASALTPEIISSHEEVMALEDTKIMIDLEGVTKFDTAGALLFESRVRQLRSNGNEVVLKVEDDTIRHMLDLARSHAHPETTFTVKGPGPIEGIGRVVVESLHDLKGLSCFVGKTAMSMWRTLLHPRTLRWKELLYQMDESAIRALWIIAVTMLLIGIVVAYQSSVQLKTFGANIFIVEMLGISIMRELAPMLTAIIVAGRSGSAFAAQIGVMKMTEEIDAMKAMGFEPFSFLVLPRILALIVMMPILVFFADIMGILGGMVIADLDLDVSITLFLERFRQVIDLKHFWVGIIKAPFFAILIASIGIYRGMLVKEDTQSIGINTTKSVVEAIFAVIICDALFSVVFTRLGF
jgi:phospholipid/cholesterol/gamma-HCH transport system permease protein